MGIAHFVWGKVSNLVDNNEQMDTVNQPGLVYTRMSAFICISLAIMVSFMIASVAAGNVPIASQKFTIISEPDLSLHPIYSSYNFSHENNVIDIGIQPLWIPPGIITEAMKRDAVLQRTLSEYGMELRFNAFLKGADVNFFLKRGDLEIATAGDMPMLTASASYDTTVTSLIQYGYSSIVARQHMLVPELREKNSLWIWI